MVTALREPGPVPIASRLPDDSEVDAACARRPPGEVRAAPHRYPRGHDGFEMTGPAGAVVMMWSER
jgi:hypothetical protein